MQKIIALFFITLVVVSCKKDKVATGAVSVTMVNVIPDSRPLAASFNGTGPVRFIDTKQLYYGNYTTWNNRFEMAPGLQLIGLYQYPDTLEKDLPLYNLRLNLPESSISTLFLTGSVQEPDTLLLRENIPSYAVSDSSMGMRFINLMKGSTPVSVNLAGEANGSTVTSLQYKSATAFLKFDVKKAISTYVFEFRDAASGNFHVSYEATEIGGALSHNAWLYNNFTLVLIGKAGSTGSDAPQLLLIRHI